MPLLIDATSVKNPSCLKSSLLSLSSLVAPETAFKALKSGYDKAWYSSIIRDMFPWKRHQMETFSALLTICAGNSLVPGELPAQRPVTRSFDVFFDLRLNKRLIKQSWGWWFKTLSRRLWRHCNARELNLMEIPEYEMLENKNNIATIYNLMRPADKPSLKPMLISKLECTWFNRPMRQ